MTMNKKTLFLFRRDLRLDDNTGLIQSLINSETVIPCFIYDINLIKNSKVQNYRWDFLNQSLNDLNDQLELKKSNLQIFIGNPSEIIKKIICDQKIDSVFCNIDFSEYSKKRDEKIFNVCQKHDVSFHGYLDFLLLNPNEIKTNELKPYTIYSHFFKKAKQYPIRKILKNSFHNYSNEPISDEKIQKSSIKDIKIPGGRHEGLKILKNLKNFKNYSNSRDFPSQETTKISPHNKFGTVSIREVIFEIQNTLGKDHVLINQIYWREFFNHILFHFPYSRNKSFKKKFENISWSKDQNKFQAWKDAQTGFPIIDAGMRELNSTGFMHNRLRMIVASFLTKDLHIDWRLGERYFADKLIDYDPAVNNGNWQWAASTGCDAVPYFRIFNPWRQQEKFDQKCTYIKNWIPELQEFSPKQIHNFWKVHPTESDYPKPIVDHKEEAKKSKEIFQKV